MKANEAPEKLYISYEGYGVFGEDGSTERTKISQIEYTRTDAFIEKACEWIRDNYLLYPNEDCADTKKFMTDFKNYMKGE